MDRKITNSDEAFTAACTERGYDPATILPDVSKMPEGLGKYTQSNIKRLVIAEAINEGRKPIYNGSERHYFPVWDMDVKGSPFGFSLTRTDYWGTSTLVGPRLEFFTEADSDYFGENFMDLHADVLLYK